MKTTTKINLYFITFVLALASCSAPQEKTTEQPQQPVKKKESDLQDAKWNRSVYEYDENSSDLVLNPNVNAGYNLAKRVRNIVNPDSIKSKRIYV